MQKKKQSFDSHSSYLLKVYSVIINITFTARLAKDTMGEFGKAFLKRKKVIVPYIFMGGLE